MYDSDIIDVLSDVELEDEHACVVNLKVHDILIGMIAEENIVAKNGILLTPKGQKITLPVLQGLLDPDKVELGTCQGSAPTNRQSSMNYLVSMI